MYAFDASSVSFLVLLAVYLDNSARLYLWEVFLPVYPLELIVLLRFLRKLPELGIANSDARWRLVMRLRLPFLLCWQLLGTLQDAEVINIAPVAVHAPILFILLCMLLAQLLIFLVGTKRQWRTELRARREWESILSRKPRVSPHLKLEHLIDLKIAQHRYFAPKRRNGDEGKQSDNDRTDAVAIIVLPGDQPFVI